jgi:hypothetical protein
VEQRDATPPTCRVESSVDEGVRSTLAGMVLTVPPFSIVDVRRGDALAFVVNGDARNKELRHVDAKASESRDKEFKRGDASEVGHDVAAVNGSQEELTQEKGMEPFDVFVTSPQLRNEIGIGIIDTGAQVSLVRGKSLKKSSLKKCKDIHVNI